jgi:hypothetical protein
MIHVLPIRLRAVLDRVQEKCHTNSQVGKFNVAVPHVQLGTVSGTRTWHMRTSPGPLILLPVTVSPSIE